MLVLQAADLHLELVRYGQTIEDQEALLDRFVDKAIELEVKVVVLSGDTFHHRKPGPHAILLLVRAIRRLTRAGIAVVIGPGNHDGSPEVEDIVKTGAWLAEIQMPRLHSFPRTGQVDVAGLTFHVQPYVHRRALAAAYLEDDIRNAATKDKVFVGHLSVRGAQVGAETFMQMGWDLTVPADVFEGYAGAMLGHLHWQQNFGPNAWYAGSSERHDFGEAGQEKGWLLWDFTSATPTVTSIPSGARDMLVLDIRHGDLSVLERVTPGSVVRARVHPDGAELFLPAAVRGLARKIKELGAAWVRVDVEALKVRRERGRSLDPAASMSDALRAWCEVTGEDYTRLEARARSLIG